MTRGRRFYFHCKFKRVLFFRRSPVERSTQPGEVLILAWLTNTYHILFFMKNTVAHPYR